MMKTPGKRFALHEIPQSDGTVVLIVVWSGLTAEEAAIARSEVQALNDYPAAGEGERSDATH